ncbi:MAG: hypothetical protein SGI89_08880 [bacterium]|nr:hypothetical protein [bacterium]
MTQVDNSPLRFAIYGGDQDQNGSVDITDVITIFNDGNNFVTGYVPSDTNGDYAVDAVDMLIAYNNSNAFVTAITP